MGLRERHKERSMKPPPTETEMSNQESKPDRQTDRQPPEFPDIPKPVSWVLRSPHVLATQPPSCSNCAGGFLLRTRPRDPPGPALTWGRQDPGGLRPSASSRGEGGCRPPGRAAGPSGSQRRSLWRVLAGWWAPLGESHRGSGCWGLQPEGGPAWGGGRVRPLTVDLHTEGHAGAARGIVGRAAVVAPVGRAQGLQLEEPALLWELGVGIRL